MIKLKDILVESVMQSKEVVDAINFAKEAHRTQRRKYTGEPLVVHPIEVALMLAKEGLPKDTIIAALLHDVVEDTKVTLNDIRKKFGIKIASMVDMVTDLTKSSPNETWSERAKRKKVDIQHLSIASNEAKSIKLADLIMNSTSIIRSDPEFAVAYMDEVRQFLEVLKGGNSKLYNKLKQIVDDYYK